MIDVYNWLHIPSQSCFHASFLKLAPKKNRRFLTWKRLFLSSIRQTWGSAGGGPRARGRRKLISIAHWEMTASCLQRALTQLTLPAWYKRKNPVVFITHCVFSLFGLALSFCTKPDLLNDLQGHQVSHGQGLWFHGCEAWCQLNLDMTWASWCIIFFSKLTMSTEIVAGLTTSSFYAVHCQRHRAKSQPGWGIGKTFFRRKIVGALRGFTDVFLFHTGLERCNLGGPGDGNPTSFFEDR